MWDTAKYWTDRADAAVRHAKYKERPDVRARRIKTLEADKRKQERRIAESQKFLKMWQREGLTRNLALAISNQDHITVYYTKEKYPASTYEGANTLWSGLDKGIINEQEAAVIAIRVHERSIAFVQRWLTHYENRIAYERAMLAEGGGTIADKTGPEKGGACRCWASPCEGWSYIQKVNKVSVTVLDNWNNGGDVQAKRKAGLLIESADCIGFFLRPTPPEEPKEQDPEAALRRLWDAQGVSQERQDELIADTTAKAQPGAKIGPFTLGGKID
jgi:hypothetical protein